MTISVIVPTYRRPADLRRCLEALRLQRRRPDQLLVTVRDTDADTRQFFAAGEFADLLPRIIDVSEPGVIAAMNAALAVAAGDVIALTDDDAAPWPDWLEKIESHFAADPKLGGLGGRDWQYYSGKLNLDGRPTICGQLLWFGRITAGHHLAPPGPPYQTFTIKGVNSAYRAQALKPIGFDTRLAGAGAQVHWELSLGLAVRRAGWTLLFDPALGVDHFPASRFDEDQRASFNGIAHQNAVANETRVLLDYLTPLRRWVFLCWSVLVGTSSYMGLAQLARSVLTGRPGAGPRWWWTLRGRWAGYGLFRADRAKSSGAKTNGSGA